MEQDPSRQIYAALNRGDAETVRRILHENPEQLVHYPGVASSWLHYAARKGKSSVVDVFLAAGLDVNWGRRHKGDTPLEDAVGCGHFETTEHLLSRGANPNLGRELIAAMNAKQNQFELVKVLVEHGADVNRCWSFGDEENGPLFNALSWAISKRRDDIADYLRAHGAVMPDTKASEVPPSPAGEIMAFFQQRFGEADPEVLREIVPTGDSPVVVHRIGPTAARNSQILFTTGMSAQPMHAPAGGEQFRYAELVIELPVDWPLAGEALRDANHRWPIDWLRKVAAYPREEKTWLGGPFVIMSNGEPPAAFSPKCSFSAMLILTGYDDFGPIRLKDGKLVQIYTLIPLYAEEKELEKQYDLAELFRRLDQFGIERIVDPNRRNVAGLH